MISPSELDHFAEYQWLATKELLSVKESQELFYWISKRQDQMKPARIGSETKKSRQSEIRSDSILWMDPSSDPIFEVWNHKINEVSRILSEAFLLSIKSSEFHFAHYPKGSFYLRHIDQPKSQHNRLISVVHYLNQEWQTEWGGQLVLYPGENAEPRNKGKSLIKKRPIQFEPQSPTTLFFQSHKMEHEVLTTEKDRFSLTGWLLG